jgi:hypothetical protein
MRRALLVLIALLAALLASSPAHAMCTAGRIGLEKGKPVVELPHCDPYPQ